MKHKKAIEVLIAQREQIQKRRNLAMTIAAAPYNAEIEELDLSIKELKQMVEDEGEDEKIKEIKQKYGGNRKGKRIDYNNIDFEVYPLDESVIARFRYILKESKRVLSIAELAGKVQQYEPSENLEIIKEKFGKHIRKYEAQGYLRSMGAARGKKYGLPIWWENNKLLPEFDSSYYGIRKISDGILFETGDLPAPYSIEQEEDSKKLH